MPETADPVAALAAKDIPTRAAGTRDLANAGEPAHLERLSAMATTDVSPGVRFGAAAAVADILSRHRLAHKAGAIDAAARESLLKTVSGTDPGVNTGLFQVCATVGIPGGRARIFAAMRDPRVDVRNGACVGLARLCMSAAVNGDAPLEAEVVALLGDTRIKIETRAEIARVCANVGYTTALDATRGLLGEAARQVGKVVDEAIARLEQPPSPIGVWVETGTDAGENNPKAKAQNRAAMLGTDDGILVLGGKVMRGPLPQPMRMMWLKAPAAEAAGPAMQVQGLTWWPGDDDDVVAIADALIAAKRFDDLDAFDATLLQSAASLRARGAGLLARDRVPEAVEALELAITLKKIPNDAWWFLADALDRAGRAPDAKPHLEKFLSKAGKKAPFVAEARRRLESP